MLKTTIIELTCCTEDIQTFVQMNMEEEASDGNTLYMYETDANLARWYVDPEGSLPVLLEGIPFYGSHSAGGRHHASVFASDGTHFATASNAQCYEHAVCFDGEGSRDAIGPVAQVSRDGNLDQVDLTNAMRYWKVRTAAEAMIRNSPGAKATGIGIAPDSRGETLDENKEDARN